MCSSLRLFISLSIVQHCVYCAVLRLQDPVYAQIPSQYLFTPRDYQLINDLQPPDKNAYFYYFSPVGVSSRKYEKLPVHEKLPAEEKLPQVELEKPRRSRRIVGYPSVFLEPPAANAISNYDKFKGRSANSWGQEANDGPPRNHRPNAAVKSHKEKKKQEELPKYVRDHAPASQQETKDSEVTSKIKKPSETLELSTDGDRIEFQIQGHEGPKTYIFGYDTGDGKNRQFRLEERLKDGTVKGHYGYYDARGKLRTIRYLARPLHGYQEKHHESNNISSEET